MKRDRIVRMLLLTLCLLGAVSVSAQQPPTTNTAATANTAVGRDGPGIAWQQLSAEQQQLLGGMQEQWSQIPPGRQVALANGAKRFLKMDAKQRQQANSRFEQWNTLSDTDRQAITERFVEFRRLPADEKARIRQNARRFDNLSPEQRQRLRQRFQDLSPEERARAREQLRNRPRPRRQ